MRVSVSCPLLNSLFLRSDNTANQINFFRNYLNCLAKLLKSFNFKAFKVFCLLRNNDIALIQDTVEFFFIRKSEVCIIKMLILSDQLINK